MESIVIKTLSGISDAAKDVIQLIGNDRIVCFLWQHGCREDNTYQSNLS